MILRFVIVFWLAIVLAQAGARGGDLTRKEQEAAKKLYDGKCARCHRMYDPRDYSDEEWRLWMAKMSKKAKLKPSQEKLLNQFLDAYRTGIQPPASPKTPVPNPGAQSSAASVGQLAPPAQK